MEFLKFRYLGLRMKKSIFLVDCHICFFSDCHIFRLISVLKNLHDTSNDFFYSGHCLVDNVLVLQGEKRWKTP